jgi:hypothetical protein
MGIRDQRIKIGFSIQTIRRAVYHIQNNKDLKFQTGYVQYDNNEIPVWRPYDPHDTSYEASWKKGIWQNIYDLRMNHKKGTKYIEYEVAQLQIGDRSISLPTVSTKLMFGFEEYLKKINI